MNHTTLLGRLRSCVSGLTIVLSAALFSVIVAGCEQGAEGDRCNPDLNGNECNAGLTCQEPTACAAIGAGITYCCPADLSSSSDPHCSNDILECPASEGATEAGDETGAEGAADAGGNDATDATLPLDSATSGGDADAGADSTSSG